MSLKLPVKSSHNPLSKSSRTMCPLVGELSNWHDYNLRFSGFPDLFGKVS